MAIQDNPFNFDQNGNYINPTGFSAGNPSFGTNASQFNIPSMTNAFPFQQQANESSNWLNTMATGIPALRAKTEQNYGIPQLRQQLLGQTGAINQMQNAITDLPSTVAGTTQDSLVTEGQRQAMINAQSVPLTRNLTNLQRGLVGTQNLLGSQQTAAEGAINQGMLPWNVGTDMLTQRQAREFTGWTTTNENELNRLIKNQAAGLAWSTDEADRANRLAIQESQYRQALEVAKLNNQPTQANPFMMVGEGSAVYDPTTGQMIYKNPKTYAPGTGTSGGGSANDPLGLGF